MPKQWYIITAINGQEDKVAADLWEKIKNFNYTDKVEDIRVLKHKVVEEFEYAADDANLPATKRNSKTIEWFRLPNGRYKKVRTRILNKFPTYIFIRVDLNNQLWYDIRNTRGVLGVIGSTGSGALPIPISDEEFERISRDKNEPVKTLVTENEPKKVDINFKVGQTVTISDGTFKGEKGTVQSIDFEKNLVKVSIEFFGRQQIIEVPAQNIKIS